MTNTKQAGSRSWIDRATYGRTPYPRTSDVVISKPDAAIHAIERKLSQAEISALSMGVALGRDERAKLIAAAPDLLAALRDLCNATDRPQTRGVLSEAYDAARAALAKAES